MSASKASLDTVLTTLINPALGLVERLGGPKASPKAARLMIAIGLTESRFTARQQVGGPAHGFWQFETEAVEEVLENRFTRPIALRICQDLNIDADMQTIYKLFSTPAGDLIAACFARLNIFISPLTLPDTANEGWVYYVSTWRPGHPNPNVWPPNWQDAVLVAG